MKRITTIFLLALLGGNLAWADGATGVQDGHARVRFFGQAVIGLTYYENKACIGDDGVDASKSGLGGFFSHKKNISLGMPETPNVVNLKNRDGILSKAFYHEYYVGAGQPLTISATYSETTGRSGYRCDEMDATFVPEDKKDYEVALDFGNGQCHLNVTQIDATTVPVKLLPIKLQPAKECPEDPSE